MIQELLCEMLNMELCELSMRKYWNLEVLLLDLSVDKQWRYDGQKQAFGLVKSKFIEVKGTFDFHYINPLSDPHCSQFFEES